MNRGVKQGSVLSPTLFLIVMDDILKRMRASNCGLSIRGVYAGAAVHADDLRTTAASLDVIRDQVKIIDDFTTTTCLKLNISKLEVMRFSRLSYPPEIIDIANKSLVTTSAAKCLGVWWHSNLSATHSVSENIKKARRAFFALGSINAFQGELNPLSSASIFEVCIIPILLYGCETWLLDSSSLNLLERFQSEIGRRILRLPKFYSRRAVRIGLHWPSMSTRILLRKLVFLSKLLSPSKDTLSSRIFTSLAIGDIYNTSIVQQCLMLESHLNMDCTAKCLMDPDNSISTIKSLKPDILRRDFKQLISTSLQHSSVKLIAAVAESTSWRRLWDIALDRGVKGTRAMQFLFRELCRPGIGTRLCKMCNEQLSDEVNCFEHACLQHHDMVGGLSCNQLISILRDNNSADTIFSTIQHISSGKLLWY